MIGYFGYQLYIRDLANVGEQPKPTKVAKVKPQPAGPSAADLERAAAEERARKKVKFEKALADLIQTLIRRELSGPFGAQSLVAQARANAQTPEEQSTIDKYEKLSNAVQDFWRVVGDRVKKFRPAEEVPLGKTRIIVIEAEDGKFSVKAGRRIINCSIETIPVWLVNALIEGMPANDRPSKKAYAAFLALDPEGDRARAKELWSGLVSTDNTVESLLALLDSLPSPPKQ